MVQRELHQPPQEGESRGSRVLVCGSEQRPRPYRHHSGFSQQFDDRVDRRGNVVVAARGDVCRVVVWARFRRIRRRVFRSGLRFFFGRAKVGRGDGVGRDRGRRRRRRPRLPRHLKEGARVGRCRVAAARSPSLPFDRDVVEVLLRLGQEIVETVHLRPGVGQAAASLHHLVKVVVVFGLQRDEERNDRIPPIGSLRPHQIAAHFTLDHVTTRLAVHLLVAIHRLVITRFRRFERARVEYTDVPGEADDHQVLVEGGDGACSHRVSGVHQHFEPFAEAIDIELFVASRLRVAPQIELEQRGELRGRGGRDELAARIESAVLNEPMQSLRREVRDDPREGCRVQETREPLFHRFLIARRRFAVRGFRHGPAMIPVLPTKKQS